MWSCHSSCQPSKSYLGSCSASSLPSTCHILIWLLWASLERSEVRVCFSSSLVHTTEHLRAGWRRLLRHTAWKYRLASSPALSRPDFWNCRFTGWPGPEVNGPDCGKRPGPEVKTAQPGAGVTGPALRRGARRCGEGPGAEARGGQSPAAAPSGAPKSPPPPQPRRAPCSPARFGGSSRIPAYPQGQDPGAARAGIAPVSVPLLRHRGQDRRGGRSAPAPGRQPLPGACGERGRLCPFKLQLFFSAAPIFSSSSW